jgi:hypothetical protein
VGRVDVSAEVRKQAVAVVGSRVRHLLHLEVGGAGKECRRGRGKRVRDDPSPQPPCGRGIAAWPTRGRSRSAAGGPDRPQLLRATRQSAPKRCADEDRRRSSAVMNAHRRIVRKTDGRRARTCVRSHHDPGCVSIEPASAFGLAAPAAALVALAGVTFTSALDDSTPTAATSSPSTGAFRARAPWCRFADGGLGRGARPNRYRLP